MQPSFAICPFARESSRNAWVRRCICISPAGRFPSRVDVTRGQTSLSAWSYVTILVDLFRPDPRRLTGFQGPSHEDSNTSSNDRPCDPQRCSHMCLPLTGNSWNCINLAGSEGNGHHMCTVKQCSHLRRASPHHHLRVVYSVYHVHGASQQPVAVDPVLPGCLNKCLPHASNPSMSRVCKYRLID